MDTKSDDLNDTSRILCEQCATPNLPDATRCKRCDSLLNRAPSWGAIWHWSLLARHAVRGPITPAGERLLVLVLLGFLALVVLGFLNELSRASMSYDILSACIVLVCGYFAWIALRRLLRRK